MNYEKTCTNCRFREVEQNLYPCAVCSCNYRNMFEQHKPKLTRAEKFFQLIEGTEFEDKFELNNCSVPATSCTECEWCKGFWSEEAKGEE